MKLSDIPAKGHFYYLASPYSTPTWSEIYKYSIGSLGEAPLNQSFQSIGTNRAQLVASHEHQFKTVKFNKYPKPAYEGEGCLRDIRYEIVEKVATLLINEGYCMFEPIATCYHKEQKYHLPCNFEYWAERDKLAIDRSDGIIVVCIDGWDKSNGVMKEIEHAWDTGKPVYLLTIDFSDTRIITNVENFG